MKMERLQKNAAAAHLFTGVLRLADRMRSLPARVVPPPLRLVQMGAAFWTSCALAAAARIGVADALGDESVTVEELAARVGAEPDPLFRLLRMLAAADVFEQMPARRFRNNTTSSFLRRDHPQSVRTMVLMHNSPEMSRPWYEALEAGVRSGEAPFRQIHGVDLYGYLDAHTEFDRLFTAAMESVESLAGDAFATDFDWSRFGRVIDLGGSSGDKAVAILKRHPQLRALVVDRPQVIERARARWEGRESDELLARIEFEPGDLFAALPPARDARDIYLLSAVLHGFDDRACVRLLRGVAGAAGGSGATVAVLEMVVPERRADYASASFDMQMFMATRGRERTLGEWRALAGDAGFAVSEVVALRSLGAILVLHAAGGDRSPVRA